MNLDHSILHQVKISQIRVIRNQKISLLPFSKIAAVATLRFDVAPGMLQLGRKSNEWKVRMWQNEANFHPLEREIQLRAPFSAEC